MKLKHLSLVSIKPIRSRQWPNLSQNKAISIKDDSSVSPVIALFLCCGGGICHVMETSPYNYWSHCRSFILYTVLKQIHKD